MTGNSNVLPHTDTDPQETKEWLESLAAAIRQAGSVEGTRIREALENLQAPVDGVVMTYHRPFSADNHETLHSTQQIHLGEIRNGEVVFAREGTPPRNPLP